MADYDVEQIKTTKFHGGMGQSLRVHYLQHTLNICNSNPLLFNMDHGIYNYELIFASLNSLVSEVWGKMNESERTEITKKRKEVDELIEKNPIISSNAVMRRKQMNKENWKNLREKLIEYEMEVRDIIDLHGLNNPDREEDDDEL